MIVLVTGGRGFMLSGFVKKVLDRMHAERPITLIVHGACGDTMEAPRGRPAYQGADAWAHDWATANNVPTRVYPAAWRTLGKTRAGKERNRRMFISTMPDLVIAFPGGNGTEDMVKFAKQCGANVIREEP